ncbi:MAG: FG-GAP-like repeat-containing protein [Chitinophagia bacterium]
MILSKLKQALLGATLVLSSLVMQLNAQSSSPRRIIVDATSTTNSGTSFSTIKMAVDSSRDRDTILVKEGTYKEKIIVGGSKRLVFASEFLLDGVKTHINNTIISGAGVTQNSLNDVLFGAFGNTYDSTYFKFVGFTIDSAAKYGMEVRGGLVTDCIFKNSGSLTTVPFYFQGTYLRNITVYNNIGTAIIAFNGVGAQNTNAPYAVIENGLFYNNRGVSQNQNNERGPYGGNLGGVIWFNGDVKAKLLNSIFYNNSGDHLLIMGGGSAYDVIDVYNNVFYKNKTRTAFFRTWEGDYGRNNCTSRWYNNIIDNNYLLASQSNASEFAWGGGPGNTKPFNYIFKNNIFSETLNTSTQTGFTTGFTFSYDTASHIISTVQFEDTANLNFALKNTSAGIGAGIASLVPTKDFNGNARPNPTGSIFDIGAIESARTYPTPIILSLQNAISSAKNAVKVSFSLPVKPVGDSIIIYRHTATDTAVLLTKPIDSIAFSSGTQVIFNDTNAVLNARTYYYAIKTLFANKSKSALSNVASITTPSTVSSISKPTALALVTTGRSGVSLTWSSTTKYSGGGTTPTNTPYIDIYRGLSASSATLLVDNLRDTTSTYSDKTTLPSTTYYYYLVSRGTDGVVSENSDVVSLQTNSSVTATKWFVKTTGLDNDNTNGSDESSPFKTLSYTFSKAIKGDTVIILPGTYNEKVQVNAGVVVGSKYLLNKQDTAVIRTTILNAAGLSNNMISYTSSNTNNTWIRTQFVGLHFKGAAGSNKMLFNFNGSWQKPVTIDKCLFTYNGPSAFLAVEGRNPDQDIIYAQFQDSTIIKNSTFENNYGKLRFDGQGIEINNNIFKNNNQGYTRPNNQWIGTGVIEGWVRGKTSITNNIFFNNGQAVNDMNQVYVAYFGGNDSLFYSNNTFVNNNVPAIKFQTQPNPKVYITNNIFHNNKLDAFSWNNSVADTYVRNNFFNSDPNNNNYFTQMGSIIENNIYDKDPNFEDSVKFTLSSSSNLINSGSNFTGLNKNVAIPSTDFFGNSRPGPSGSNADIGAVESSFGFPSPYLISTDGSDKKVTLKWRKPVNGSINGYEIFRATSTIPSSVSSATYTIANADSVVLIDSNLTNLTKYFYRVRAYSGSSSKIYSGLSNELFVQPNIPPTGVDTLSAFAGTRNIALKWVDTAGKRKYNVYRGNLATNLEKIASAIDTNYYIDKTVKVNSKYFYAVSVVDNVGASSILSKLSNATATNIWVIDTAGKETNNASSMMPLKSIQYAIDNSLVGDTIILNDGSYFENLDLVKKAVTIMAKNRGKAILNPLSTNASTNPIIRIRDQNWGGNEYSKIRNKFIGLVISGSTMTQWSSNGSPSAVDVQDASNPLFESCTFSNNTSQYVFSSNWSAPEIRNSLIINNTTQNGVFNINGDSTRPTLNVLKIIYTTIANNSYLTRNCCGSEKAAVIFNSILSENGYDANFNEKFFRVVGSIVDNAKLATQSPSNKSVDPQFNNPSSNDFSLSAFSPALGMAESRFVIPGTQLNDTLNAITYDYNNATRPNPTGTAGDVGAFESKFSLAAPQITRLQRAAKAITLTWEKPDASVNYAGIKVYRDTIRTSLDTIAPLNITVDLAKNTITDELPNDKTYYYALKATLGSGASEIRTGLSNVKSVLDTIFIPAINFGTDTASFKIKTGSRNGGHVASLMHLVNLGSSTTPGLPKVIFYSQEFKSIDSTSNSPNESDYLNVLNINKGTGANSIAFSLNKRPILSKGKADYMQIVAATNVNGDDDFDFATIFRKGGTGNDKTQIAYLVNDKNLNFNIDTTNVPKQFFNSMLNPWNQTTNLTYKWDQPTFRHNEGATNGGQNIESTAEFMDGNFDGKEEMIVTLQQVKWEPNPLISFSNTSIENTSSGIKIVKFIDVNNDGIPDIFGMTNWSNSVGLGQTNGNPLVVFVSNKKAGKFFMYYTGINVDWGANLYINDFKNERKVQILTRINGGNYKVYDLDANYKSVASAMQVNAALNDGKLTVGDINNDSYPDVITVDNSGSVVAYINNQQSEFVKKKIGGIPFNANTVWSLFNLRLVDLNKDGFNDLTWIEMGQEADGSINWNSNNFVFKAWLQTKGDDNFVRKAPAAINVDNIKVSNNGYGVKVKWTPTKDNVDRYIFANIKVDTLSNYKSARINTGYNYRASDPTIPIILDRVYARNYPDSIEFNDVNLTSKKPYYISLQMVNKEGNASAYTQVIYSPKDPLQSIDNAIPGMYNAKFSWGDYNNDGLMDLAVIGQNDDIGNITKIYENKNGSFQDLNLANRAFRYGDIKWVDLNNDGWLDLSIIGQSGAAVVYQQLINNKGVFEVSTPTSVAGLKYANMTFGDYNNNGTLDMFTTGQDVNGNPKSFLYQNDGKGNFKVDPEFNAYFAVPDMYDADARFLDYDLDGDLDLIYSGTGTGGNPQGGIRVNTLLDPKITTNNYGQNSNNGYSYSMNLQMKNTKLDIADMDGDGDTDIVAMGTARKYTGNTFIDYPQLLLLRNQTAESKDAKFGSFFSYNNIYNATSIILDSVEKGDIKLVDFNNDGLVDITLAGRDVKANPVTKFYLNEGGFGNFTLSKNASIPQYTEAAISWGDANGDGSMDMVISGNKLVGSSTSIYLNDQGENINKAPSAPSNLKFIDQGQGRVLLLWDAATDDKTAPANLYYNLKLGTQPGLSDLRVIQVNPANDKLLTPNTSLIGSNQYYIELPPGVFYWSVQAVDGNYSSSKFASSQKIVLKYPWQFLNQGGLVDTRIQPLDKPSFAWADVNNKGVFDFIYLGKVVNGSDYGNFNTPVGLYRNMGGKFVKLPNDSTRSIPGISGTSGTNFKDELANLTSPEIKWVDLNNDGLLDLVVAGNDYNNGNGRLAIYKNRGNYKFENITGAIYNGVPFASPKIAFADIDQNGYVDMIYAGVDNTQSGVFKFIGLFKDTAASNKNGFKASTIKNNLDVLLTNNGISNVSLQFGDINKDLKLDLAILYDNIDGRRLGEVYMNTSDTSNNISFAKNTSLSIPALRNATLDLIDYNNDGLLDLSLSGTSSSTGQVFRIYQNKFIDSAAKTIQFVQTNSDIKPFESGQTTWGDINTDGYPDIIFSGVRAGSGSISSMALADPTTAATNGITKFKELPTFPFGNYITMRPTLGDFSGKKVLDVVLVGTEKIVNPLTNVSTISSSFKILKNVRDLSAKVIDPSPSNNNLKVRQSLAQSSAPRIVNNVVVPFADSAITIADDNYAESSYTSNAKPSKPKTSSSTIISQVGTKFLVQFNWEKATDDKTPKDGLTYAISIGTKPGLSDVIDPNADLITGIRKSPDAGNAGTNTSITLLLDQGTFYWSVQSIDASNTGSNFSDNRTIQISSNRTLTERSAPSNILLNGDSTATFVIKQNDQDGFKYKVTAKHADVAATVKFSIVSDATVTSDVIFKLDTVTNNLLLNAKPTAASYKVKLRATDNYGSYFDKTYSFGVVQAPTKLLVNEKDSSVFYYSKNNADSSKYVLSLRALYEPTPTDAPVLTYKFITGANGENNGLFDLANTVLINKRRLNDADTIRLKVAAEDANGLTIERIIKLVSLDCTTKPSLNIKASATACLPLVVNLADTALVLTGTSSKLTYSYFSDYNATVKVAAPNAVSTSGTYYIRATDSLGCSIAKPIIINVASQPAKPVVSAGLTCQNQSSVTINFAASATTNKLAWYGTNATGGTPSLAIPTFNTSATGILSYYVAQVDTSAGCYSDRIKLDINVLPTPIAPIISRDTAGNLISSSATELSWFKDGVKLTNTGASFKPSAVGSYTVKTTLNGCTSAASNTYYYLVTDIIRLSWDEFIKLTPNPFINFMNIDFVVKGHQRLNIEVFSAATGAKVATRIGVTAGSRLTFNELNPGIYFVRVASPDLKVSHQFKMVKL